jgi:hypothetical protein
MILLNNGYTITHNVYSNLVMNVELDTCFHQITNMLFEKRPALFFFALKRVVEREGELSRYTLPVLTKGTLVFVSFIFSCDQIIECVPHSVQEVKA